MDDEFVSIMGCQFWSIFKDSYASVNLNFSQQSWGSRWMNLCACLFECDLILLTPAFIAVRDFAVKLFLELTTLVIGTFDFK